MNFLNKMERKLGKYAIPNLSLYLIMGYVLGYILMFINPAMVDFLTLNPYLILRGQIWRLVTWIIVPPSEFDLFTIIMLMFYYSVGTNLERTWGTFYYNVYLFMGMFFTLIGSFLIMAVSYVPAFYSNEVRMAYGEAAYFLLVGRSFSTYFVNMSIFLGFAATFPEVQVLLMFIIPVKVKWMGIAYAVLLIVQFLQSNIVGKIVIGASLLNFVVFFLMTRSGAGMRMSPRQVKRRHDYNREVKRAKPASVSKHKCAICGKNSEDNPEAEFRFCSKCNGNYEYCQDHLFTHTHVK
ncbi:MAG: rhomboid family intramembrane serine protease [Lachnospiraceae bacterium]|nr:rhomboid family intramembrane serine protease [Lachnospiraceae bacterium]MDE6985171.1 rhomboid family intramembrane serine protease [Lachnospiraceae bacterium]MDE7030156.1 rhomboid family intramembrane serine protease [Lachnospiraceae bacterium]